MDIYSLQGRTMRCNVTNVTTINEHETVQFRKYSCQERIEKKIQIDLKYYHLIRIVNKNETSFLHFSLDC